MPEIIKKDINAILKAAFQEKTALKVKYSIAGKWRSKKSRIIALSGNSILLEPNFDDEQIKVNTPLGISFEAGHYKLVFESKVENNAEESLEIEVPVELKELPRRSYLRADIPAKMSIDVIIWHRTYCQNDCQPPKEKHLQGKLLDLSLGGVGIAITQDKEKFFDIGQQIGIQFTPLPYKTPIILECIVRHIDPGKDGAILIGSELVGLESDVQGKNKLAMILQITTEYNSINQQNG